MDWLSLFLFLCICIFVLCSSFITDMKLYIVGILGWKRFGPAVITREGSLPSKSFKIGGIKLKVSFCFGSHV